MRFKLPSFKKKSPRLKDEEIVNPNKGKLYQSKGLFKKSSRTARKKMSLKFLILLPIVVIIGAIFSIKDNPFEFKKIKIESNANCLSNNQILETAALKKNNFFTLNPDEVEQKLKLKYLCISKVELRKEFPQGLSLIIIPRQAAVEIKTFNLTPINLDLKDATPSTQEAKIITDPTQGASFNGLFLADEEGVLFDRLDNDSSFLPVINYFSEATLNLGTKLSDQSVKKTLQVQEALARLSLTSNQIQIIEDSLIIKGSPEIKFGLKKDLPKQLASLQLILQQATIDSKLVQSVDLRFEKAVVVYSSNKR